MSITGTADDALTSVQGLLEQSRQAYRHFRPRPDQPDRFDQQSAFVESRTPGVKFLVGGNGAGCLGAEQQLYDPVKGVALEVSQIDGPFHVFARTALGDVVIARATQPRIYGTENLYEVTLSTGEKIIVTAHHRVLSATGVWQEIHELAAHGLSLLSEAPIAHIERERECRAVEEPQRQFEDSCRAVSQSLSWEAGQRCAMSGAVRRATTPGDAARPLLAQQLSGSTELSPSSSWKCESHSCQTAGDCADHCSTDRRPCDEQPPSLSGIDREFVPSLSDALARILLPLPSGALDTSRGCTHLCRCDAHRAKSRFAQGVRRDCEVQCLRVSQLYSLPFDSADTRVRGASANRVAKLLTTRHRRSPGATFRNRTSAEGLRSATGISGEPLRRSIGGIQNAAHITAVRFLRRDSYWDFSVEEYENYWMAGTWHHNTTETAMHAVSRLLLRDQPPPRYDTPFWVIAGTYEQVCEACWKEKLWGHGHIPSSEVDWDRVAWFRPNDQWPYRVPLKPWPHRPGKNWVIEFKSYLQGRAQMQARSIGGFCFVEQFPWGLLTEVNRGCREYNLPGSKMAEFTPIDPMLSEPLERMLNDGKLPRGWEVYRANTECALEAGHVNQQWFDEFFGSVPEEMLLTRLTGAWASFEGAVYQGFMPHLHLVGDDKITFPPGVHHRRAIDWGFGPDNAFVCLFMYRDGVGRWFVYDEYWSTNQTYECEDHLNEIMARHDWIDNDPHYGTTYADPSSPEHFRTAARCGFHCTPASNSVLAGIDCVRSLLKNRPGTGPRIYIHKDRCPNLAREMRTYRWPEGTDTRDSGRMPLKKDDHAVDALRYCVFTEQQMTGLEPGSMSRRDEDAPARHGIHYQRRARR